MRIPLHFTGADVAPGVKQDGGIVAHPDDGSGHHHLSAEDLLEFLTVDLSHMALNQSVHLSDIKLPEGVTITSRAHGGGDLAVATITIVHEEVIEAPVAAVPVERAKPRRQRRVQQPRWRAQPRRQPEPTPRRAQQRQRRATPRRPSRARKPRRKKGSSNMLKSPSVAFFSAHGK